MKCPFCIKVCSKCGEMLVANTINFGKDKKGKHGLKSFCKKCRNKRERECYKNNPDSYKKRNKKWQENNYEKYRESNNKSWKKWKEDNPEKIKEYQREYQKKYYKAHPNKNKDWEKKNPEKAREIHNKAKRKWRKNNPDKVFNENQKRRELEKQGRGFIENSWYEMMNFFDWKCAYSGEKLTKENKTTDHIIPLSKGGENEIWNLVPMLRDLNSQKRAKDMFEWYSQQNFYSEERLSKIYKWIEYARNKYGNNNE